MAQEWIDISVPIRDGMLHWPDNPPVQLERVMDIGKGDPCNLSKLSMGVHTATHMDAPVHFLADGDDFSTMPLTATIGPARVIGISDTESIKAAELEQYHIEPGERILFKTINSTQYWQVNEFVKNFVYISEDAAKYLAERQIQTVGVDYLSVGGYFKDSSETHKALLGAKIWVIEGLNLAQVEPGNYELLCLPIKMVKSEGAPARAVLRPL
ncbi:MAG TPA: cyclase family protein [Dictyobacter sp.]|jgi:arylformamidase|nr:cyclase family protein [Dictyobacter sp.]